MKIHKPNKTEEEAEEFYRKFLERFKPKVNEIEINGQKIKRLVFEKFTGLFFPLPSGINYPSIGSTSIATTPYFFSSSSL